MHGASSLLNPHRDLLTPACRDPLTPSETLGFAPQAACPSAGAAVRRNPDCGAQTTESSFPRFWRLGLNRRSWQGGHLLRPLSRAYSDGPNLGWFDLQFFDFRQHTLSRRRTWSIELWSFPRQAIGSLTLSGDADPPSWAPTAHADNHPTSVQLFCFHFQYSIP